MDEIQDSGGRSFLHSGQLYKVAYLRGDDGWTLFVLHCPDDEMARETGHRDSLPASATDEDVRSAIARLQDRIEAGEAPDEDLNHGG